MELKNKVVVITGASSGIGKSLAENLAKRGTDLILLSRRDQPMRELAEKLKDINKNISFYPLDVTDRPSIEKIIPQAAQKSGKIDILVNCAGTGYYGPVESMKIADLETVIGTNVIGLVNMTQVLIPYLKKTRGMIVNISSGLSKRSLPYLSAYGGTKSMVDALSDGMRVELRKYGIRVLNYCPPETDTDFSKNALKENESMDSVSNRKKAKVDDVSARIVKAMIWEKREMIEGGFLKTLNFFAPKFLDNLFYKIMVSNMEKK